MHEGQVVPVTGVLEAQEKCRLDKGRASSTQHYVHFVNLFVMEAVWCVVDCLIVSLASTPRCQYTHTHTHTLIVTIKNVYRHCQMSSVR